MPNRNKHARRGSAVLTLASVFALVVLATGVVFAHTPLEPGDNESLETAVVVPDPTKSWAIYAELHEAEEVQYYMLDLREGERLVAMLYIPLEEKGFAPTLVVMGPGISESHEHEDEHEHDLPEFIEVPEGVGIMLLEAEPSAEPGYEPFSPSSYYYLASMDLEVTTPGDYFVAVYETSRGGRYGLATGYREVFTLDEWILVPLDVIGIHQWEGQSLVFILAPLIATVAIGLLVLVLQKKASLQRLSFWTASLAGLLYMGSGFMMFVQMFVALSSAGLDVSAVITVIFAIIPVLLGFGIVRPALKETMTTRTRILTASLGLAGLFLWAGLLLGPSLAFVTSLLPSKKAKI
ncbi:MAG: hypothetical protein NWE76_07080 [Candidatus Bathyarchaeota archaeon]|nr:hypothetical protein [Candidatus Bathyarchaeota archaeon]